MVVFLVFIHRCGPKCNCIGLWVYHQAPSEDGTSYVMPDLRCINTNDALSLQSVNGTPV